MNHLPVESTMHSHHTTSSSASDNLALNVDQFLEEMQHSLDDSEACDSNWKMKDNGVFNEAISTEADDFSPRCTGRYSTGYTNGGGGVTCVTIEGDRKSTVTASDSVTVGANGKLQLIWRNLTYLAKRPSFLSSAPASGRKVILEKQSGSICGGTITAIVGPSGAGKSTLLECLAGRRATGLKGDIFVSIDNSTTHPSSSSIKISLIGQRDVAIEVLTVREVLTFASRIKNYKKSSHDENVTPSLVESVIKELTLTKCADTKVAKISGGQLKRLVFGVELISGPDIILLDEPTSGLDASSAFSCIKLLRKLTDLKRNIYSHNMYKAPAIICSIHQPSARVLNHFHKIYVLSADGRCLYQDSPSKLLSHLSRYNLNCPQFHNPADFIIEIASGDYGVDSINMLAIEESERQLQQLRSEKLITVGNGAITVGMPKDRNIYMKVSKVIDCMKGQSFPTLSHIYLLWLRTIITNFREPKLTWFRLFQTLFVALLMSFLYDYPIGEADGCYPRPDAVNNEPFKSTEDNISFIFFITLFTVMASMMPTVLTFPSEVAVLIQERNNGWYSCATYYLAKVIAELPFQLVVNLLFISIIYPMTGQVAEWQRCGYFTLICLITSSIAECVGIMFSTYFVQSVENAVFLAPLSMAPAFLFSGFFGKLSALPLLLKPMAYTSYVRYAFQALLIALYGLDRCAIKQSPLHSSINSESTDKTSSSPFSSVVPSHLLNTGYVSGNQLSDSTAAAANMFKRNLSQLGIYRYNPNPGNNPPWESSTANPFALFKSQLQNSNSPATSFPVPGYSNLLQSSNPFSFNQSIDNFSLFPQGSYVLKRFEVEEHSLTFNLCVLVAFLVFLRILCYIILLLKTNQKK